VQLISHGVDVDALITLPFLLASCALGLHGYVSPALSAVHALAAAQVSYASATAAHGCAAGTFKAAMCDATPRLRLAAKS